MIDFNKPLPTTIDWMTDADVRALRDYVFERKLSDESWKQVAHRWRNPVEQKWLLQTATAMQTTRMPKR